MTTDQDRPSSSGRRLRQNRINGVFVTIVIGAIGSGLWQVAFSPGFEWLGTFLTSNWRALDAAAYSSAARDPSSTPSLVMLYSFAVIPLFVSMWFLLNGVIFPALERRRLRNLQPTTQVPDSLNSSLQRIAELELRIEDSKRRLKRLAFVGASLGLTLLITTTGMVLIVNRSVVIWRAFQSNLDMCAPYINDIEEESLRAEFRRMKNSADYTALQAKLNTVASSNGVALIALDD